jgi:hypothetical protein
LKISLSGENGASEPAGHDYDHLGQQPNLDDLLEEQAPAQSVSESGMKSVGGKQDELAQIPDKGDERGADGNEKTRYHFRCSRIFQSPRSGSERLRL